MKAVFYAAILVAVCIAQASALKCYTCENCKVSGFLSIVENSEECGLLQTSCRKWVDASGVVGRGCVTALECATVIGRCDSPSDVSCNVCCTTDNCNSAVSTKVSLVGLALALATAVFSRYL